jgi:hypothetical protein
LAKELDEKRRQKESDMILNEKRRQDEIKYKEEYVGEKEDYKLLGLKYNVIMKGFNILEKRHYWKDLKARKGYFVDDNVALKEQEDIKIENERIENERIENKRIEIEIIKRERIEKRQKNSSYYRKIRFELPRCYLTDENVIYHPQATERDKYQSDLLNQ